MTNINTRSTKPQETQKRAARSPRTASARRRRASVSYSEAQRIQAVTAALAVGQERPFSRDALAAARQVVQSNISTSTLTKWLDEFGDQARALIPTRSNAEIIIQTRDQVLQDFAEVRRKGLDELKDDSKLKSASARDLAVIVGIANDKIERMAGIPPELSSRVERIEQLCQRLNIDVLGILDRYIQVLEQNIQAQTDKNIKQLESGSTVG